MPTPATSPRSGLRGLDHPLLRAGVALAAGEGDGYVFTGRLSLRDQPWLADHRVMGRPGARRRRWSTWCCGPGRGGLRHGRELVVQAPVVMPETGGVQIQVAVGGPDRDGSREFEVFVSGPDGARAKPGRGGPRGPAGRRRRLVRGRDPLGDLAVWPPAGAEPVSLDGAYAGWPRPGSATARRSRACARCGGAAGTVFAEVALPEQVQAGVAAYGLHPALLDAAIQAIAFTDRGEDAAAALPFAFNGISRGAAGPRRCGCGSPCRAPTPPRWTWPTAPAARWPRSGRLTLRPLSAAGMTDQSDRDSLYRVDLIAAPGRSLAG